MTAATAGIGIVFVHAGRPYELLPLERWPIRAARDLAAGDIDALAPVVGGPAALAQLMADDWTVGDLRDLLERVAASPPAADGRVPVAEALSAIWDAVPALARPADESDPLAPVLQRLWDTAYAAGAGRGAP